MTSSLYRPARYYKGLSKAQKKKRRKEIEERKRLEASDPRAYRPFQTNQGAKTRPSKYNEDFAARYKNPVSVLKKKAKQSKIPLDILEEVWARGMAAWRTGHRVGASQHAWGMARVNSFATGGKTYFTADQDLARDLKKRTGIYFTKDRKRRKTKRAKNPALPSALSSSLLIGAAALSFFLGATEKESGGKRSMLFLFGTAAAGWALFRFFRKV